MHDKQKFILINLDSFCLITVKYMGGLGNQAWDPENVINPFTGLQVHDMMDDIAEQQDVAREISEAISNPVAFGHEFDDDELEAELNELEAEEELAEQEELDKQLIDVGPTAGHRLPEVPSSEPVKAKAKPKPVADDDDLAELAAWAS